MAKLPKRWEPYSAIGERIEGTKFVSFKVPLNDNLSSKVSQELRFTPSDLVQIIKDRGQKLAMVIDLTNTDRYYNKKDILEHGIKHTKIYTEGHKVPKGPIVQKFFSAVEEVLQESREDDILIGVHCTHGVNRTGYLVCRYMVEKLSIDPEIAIAAFSKARGHPIERENYLQDLRLRKDGGPGLVEDDEEQDPSDRLQDYRNYERPPRFNRHKMNNSRMYPYWQDSFDYTRGDHSSRFNRTNGQAQFRDRSPHGYGRDNGHAQFRDRSPHDYGRHHRDAQFRDRSPHDYERHNGHAQFRDRSPHDYGRHHGDAQFRDQSSHGYGRHYGDAQFRDQSSHGYGRHYGDAQFRDQSSHGYGRHHGQAQFRDRSSHGYGRQWTSDEYNSNYSDKKYRYPETNK